MASEEINWPIVLAVGVVVVALVLRHVQQQLAPVQQIAATVNKVAGATAATFKATPSFIGSIFSGGDKPGIGEFLKAKFSK